MQEELDAVIRGLGRLGAVAATPAPAGSVRTLMPLQQASYPPGVQLGRFGATGDLTVDVALKRLAVMYGQLQQAAGKIIAAFPAGPPCEVRDRHNRAVLAYKAIATPVFDALAAKGVTPTQTLLDKQGAPVKTISSSVPVLPTGWVMSDCPGGTKAPGLSGLGQVGPIPIPIIYWAILLVVAAAGGALIIRTWPTEREQFVQSYAAWADTLTTCIQTQTAKGISAADAAVACKVLVPPPPAPPEDGPSVLAVFGKWVLVLGIAGTVAYFLFRKFSPAEQQARARQMEAEEAAARLRKEAERLVQAGRRPRYQRVQQRYAPAAAYGPEAEGGYEPEMPLPDEGGFEPEMPAPRGGRYNGFQGAGARFKGCFCV